MGNSLQEAGPPGNAFVANGPQAGADRAPLAAILSHPKENCGQARRSVGNNAPQTSRPPVPTQRAIEVFALLNFAIIGLSLVFQPRAWARFFAWMRREGEAGAVIYGLFCLLWGSLIVSFHREWNGFLVILPAFGALQMTEGLVFLVAPGFGLQLMAVLTEDRLVLFRIMGAIALALAVYIYLALLPTGIL
jgi:uncharacterized protein YjeT (DUF2065 family)